MTFLYRTNGGYAWTVVFFALQFFHEIADMNETHRSIELSEQMISIPRIFHTQYFYCSTSKFLLLIQSLFSLLSLFFSFICEKAQFSLDFFDSLLLYPITPWPTHWRRRCFRG